MSDYKHVMQQKRKRLRLLFAGGFLLVLSGFVFWTHFTKQQIHSVSDLQMFQGKLSSYSFREGSRGHQYYYIYLNNLSDRCQIPADFLAGFDRTGFESKVHKGDDLKIYLNKKLWVFAIEDSTRTYLSADFTIAQYNYSDIEAGAMRFALGCIFFVGYFKYEKLARLFLRRLSSRRAVALAVVLLIAIIWWLAVHFNL